MKAKILTLLLVLAVCVVAATYDRWHVPSNIPGETSSAETKAQDLPAITFTTQDSKTYDLRKLPENGIILHFWASWCSPCAVEFPSLLKAVENSHGALALVAVSIDDNRASMEKFLSHLPKTAGPHIYWVWDKDKTISLKNFDTIRAPESVLIDAHRHMLEKIAGDPGWATPVMAQKLQALGRP